MSPILFRCIGNLSERIELYPNARMLNALETGIKCFSRRNVPMLIRLAQTILASILTVSVSLPVIAEEAANPLLTVSGDLGTIESGTIVLDLDSLMELPVTSFETSTIWTEGVHTFTGVALSDLAAELGVQRGLFFATAINDYTVEIPHSDAVEGGPIIAYLMDDSEMSIRDKGPLWIVYPYDSNSEYRSEVIYARSIWQLDRLEVVQ